MLFRNSENSRTARLLTSFIRPPLCCCQHHLVGFVDHRIALCGAQEQVLVIVFGLAERICVGSKIRDCVDKAPTVLADPFQIRCVVVASLQFFLQAQIILPLAIGQVLRNREKLIDEDVYKRQVLHHTGNPADN